MNNEEIAVALATLENRCKVSENRIADLEDSNKAIVDIAVSTKALATNMEYMAKEQEKQGKRLEQLEREPADNYKHYKQVIIGCIITGLLGAIIGTVISIIIK